MKKNITKETSFFFLFWSIVAFSLLILSYLYGYSSFMYTITVDEWEHLQASWMIGQGMLPYKDFFEHHHPLMWYMTMPFLLGTPSLTVFWSLRLIVLITFALNVFFIYAITKQLTSCRYTPFLSIFFYLINYITITEFADFRPDHFMISGMLGGILFLLLYLNQKDSFSLNLSFLFFFISFCFLQKIIIFFLPLGFLCLITLLKKRIILKDAFKAIILPLVLTVLYVIYLYFTDSLKDYFELNWLLNKAWFRDYEDPLPHSCQVYLWLGLFCATIQAFSSKEFVNRFFFVLTIFYFACWYAFPKPYHTYYLSIIPFLSIGWSCFFQKYILPYKIIRYSSIFLLFYFLIDSLFYVQERLNENISSSRQRPITYVLSVMKPTDQIVSFSSSFLVPFHKPVSYYWFGLSRGAFWDKMLFDRQPLPDLNKIIMQEKPRFVYKGYIYNQQYTDNMDISDIAYETDINILNSYYQKTIYPNLYERKNDNQDDER